MGFRKRYLLVLTAMIGAALAASPVAASGQASPTLVTSGLDAPRGVAFFKGHLMVAESGRGGPNCSTSPAPPSFGAFCFGRTGRISTVNLATQGHTPFVDKLFSLREWVGPNPDSLGLGGLSVRGGKLFAIQGVYPQLFNDSACAPGDSGCAADLAAARQQAGALLSVSPNGSFRVVANVGAHDYDFTANIPNQEHDSNPFGVLAANGGAYVADAGSNTLNFVSNGGRISILHYFPNRYAAFPSDEVPTCVARTGDGLWVATLSGNLYKVRGTSAIQIQNAELKHVTGCASDGEGNVYFVNMWTTPSFPAPGNGNIVKFNTEERTNAVIASGLNFPNMDTIGPDGNLYFSADSVCPSEGIAPLCPSGGTVWKLALAHEEDHDDNGGGGDNGNGGGD